ncbi:hypothetical protein SADUNF_Sadunf02G0072900 [Salix dunnii]|uniref:Amino acid transporter transmembrane domain-containing protein n=1 Tax=Salix dunnii TaxID=1413687 RepID=A0A835TGT6_9ROSI|nr:hypothetical protein SADUNF_Sadunf02G0072900 [Salix dunnii]
MFNIVAQVLLTLPYSFSQLGLLSGILFQLLYGLMGSWTAYLISVLYVEYRTRKERENVDFRNHVIQWFEVLDGLQLIAYASSIYYINDNLDKRTWTYIFGACCATTVFVPSFHNYRIWSFLGLVMTSYTAWYMTIASLIHGQIEEVKHSGPTTMVLYFTGATNILYTFGGHAITVEIMHATWKPQTFKLIYLIETLYVLTLTLPSASAVYWAFGDLLLTHSNALSLLPKNGYRDTAFITFGFACTPLYFVWEKFLRVHDTERVKKSSGKASCGDTNLIVISKNPEHLGRRERHLDLVTDVDDQCIGYVPDTIPISIPAGLEALNIIGNKNCYGAHVRVSHHPES